MKLLAIALLIGGVAAAGAALGSPQSASAGKQAYQKCYSCHAVEAGKNDLAGPSLHGIVGRPVASINGFDYSPALRRFASANPRWTRPLLDRYAADPEGLVPGTNMAFHGMPEPKERKALLDYLATLNN
jgi:cytochrome c